MAFLPSFYEKIDCDKIHLVLKFSHADDNFFFKSLLGDRVVSFSVVLSLESSSSFLVSGRKGEKNDF